MTEKDIILEVIRRVLADPAMQKLMDGCVSDNLVEKKNALLLLDCCNDPAGALDKIAGLWSNDYNFKVIVSENFSPLKIELPKCMTEENPFNLSSTKYDRVFVPGCPTGTLVKMALGICDTHITYAVHRAFAEGTPVVIVADPCLTENASPAYRDLFNGYIDKLRSFGAVVHNNITELCPHCPTGLCAGNSDNRGTADLAQEKMGVCPIVEPAAVGLLLTGTQDNAVKITSRFISERDILNLPRGSVIMIQKNAILSPLAKERMQDRNIDVLREGEV